MRPKSIQRLRELTRALSSSERRDLLELLRSDDPDLRSEAVRLLCETETPERTELPTAEVSAGETAYRVIGPYTLLQKIGEGGMGEVWVAEQTEPVHRRVAMKIIRRGMGTKQVVARFEAERQALALMDHPYIAKIFDAGVTPGGRPYFAMEYVEGVPITDHCDRRRLTTRERLELFRRVCAGVQHAHQKAIIHRDLKPTNVLVTEQDREAVPKIIDFGVAKATGHRLTDKTMFTELGALLGTPEYMSPEQAELSGRNIDTRTDVYSLGLILYDLLVGVPALDLVSMPRSDFDEIRRKIREEEPLRPSSRVVALGKAFVALAERRRTDPSRLAGQLRGDLDWIVMKALEKDRNRRYGSPAEFAADIERHLTDRPVLAGPPGALYRARKFTRRHRFVVGVAALMATVLIAFSATTALQSRRIAREAATATQISAFLTDLFRVSDPSQARGRTVTARELLDRGAGRIERDLADRPLVQARLMTTIGGVYRELGLFEQAAPLLERSWQRHEELLGDRDRDSLAAKYELGLLRQEQGRFDEAQALHSEILEARRRLLGVEHPDTLSAMNALGIALQLQGHYTEAEAMLRETLDSRRRVLGEEHADTLRSMANLAVTAKQQERYEDAEALFRRMLEVGPRVLGEDHPSLLTTTNSLASVVRRQGRLEEAERLYLEALEQSDRVLGEEHPDRLTTTNNLANLYRSMGRLGDAAELHRKSLDIHRRVLGAEHPNTLRSLANLAVVLINQEHHDEAGERLAEAVAGYERTLGKEHPETIRTTVNLAIVRGKQGRFDQAEALYLETLAEVRRSLGDRHAWTVWITDNLATLYRATTRPQRAEEVLAEHLGFFRRAAESTEADAAAKNEYAWQLLTCQLESLQSLPAALRFALEANGMTEFGNPGFLDTLALAYHRTGDTPSAVATQRKAIALLPAGSRRDGFQERLREFEAAAGSNPPQAR